MVGSADGATDYDGPVGRAYPQGRHTDPRIAARIMAAIGDAETILNVGAGTGSYEPADRELVAVEPSATMRAARPEGAAPVIDAKAESLPFDDDSFDASMACITIHHWDDPAAGLREMRRVTKGPVVILTLDIPHHVNWQRDYFAPLMAIERRRFPSPAEIAPILGRRNRIDTLRTPIDCQDGFVDAFWARPDAFLDPQVRAAQSVWGCLDPGVEEEVIAHLEADLESGVWEAAHGHLRTHADYDGALRLIVDGANVVEDFPRRI